jgi:hypothetical protein
VHDNRVLKNYPSTTAAIAQYRVLYSPNSAATPIQCMLHYAHVLVTQAFSSGPPPSTPPSSASGLRPPLAISPDQACMVLYFIISVALLPPCAPLQRPNSWTKSRQKSYEFSSLYYSQRPPQISISSNSHNLLLFLEVNYCTL